MAAFQVGDVVMLKSGGPDMTVSYDEPVRFPSGTRTDLVTCTWFDGKKLVSDSFADKLLKRVVSN